MLIKGSHGLRMDRITSLLEVAFMNKTAFVLSLAMLSFVMTVIWGQPLLRILRHFRIGKLIRVDEPGHHNVKMGTPTMGGVLFILPVLLLNRFVERGCIHRPGSDRPFGACAFDCSGRVCLTRRVG